MAQHRQASLSLSLSLSLSSELLFATFSGKKGRKLLQKLVICVLINGQGKEVPNL